jgi:hypothetical protein
MLARVLRIDFPIYPDIISLPRIDMPGRTARFVNKRYNTNVAVIYQENDLDVYLTTKHGWAMIKSSCFPLPRACG